MHVNTNSPMFSSRPLLPVDSVKSSTVSFCWLIGSSIAKIFEVVAVAVEFTNAKVEPLFELMSEKKPNCKNPYIYNGCFPKPKMCSHAFNSIMLFLFFSPFS